MDDIKKEISNLQEVLNEVRLKITKIEEKIADECVHNWIIESQLCIRDNGEYDYVCTTCGKRK